MIGYPKSNNKRISKRKKAVSIPKDVKIEVALRDGGNCIVCGRVGVPNAHIIPRSAGGMGIKENIVTLCMNCHHEFDNGKNKEYYKYKIYKYIKSIYPNWNKEKMIFKKYKEV